MNYSILPFTPFQERIKITSTNLHPNPKRRTLTNNAIKFAFLYTFIRALEEYLWYYNNERISIKLKGMSPVQYRTHSQI
ncbi:MAG: hypothetical protein E7349_02160 [Clostridiales bacterium]|nr:hypothetical protein [Clostridiales bacterium]